MFDYSKYVIDESIINILPEVVFIYELSKIYIYYLE